VGSNLIFLDFAFISEKILIIIFGAFIIFVFAFKY
jgi:hypothetical protein